MTTKYSLKSLLLSKYIRAAILLFVFLLPLNKAFAQIISISPIPDSKYHNTETSVIVKFDSPVNTSVSNWTINIVGTKSGSLKTKQVLSHDKKTLIIKPESSFSYSETVFVEINPDLKETNPDFYYEFKFHIKSSEVPLKESDPFVQNDVKGSSEYFPPITVNVNNNPAEGKIFFHNISALASENDRFYAIMENDGTPFFAEQDNDKGLSFTLQKSGYISFWNNKNFFIMDSMYQIIDTIACGNGYEADWHEFQMLENGHAFLIAWDVQIVDMSTIVAGGQEFASVEGFIIQELDEDENVVFEWRSWDHFEITDAVDVDFTTSYISYTHGNALDVDNEGNILVSSRLMNEITKIDGTTGDIIWRLGGKKNEFTFIDDDGFCRQHDIRRLANGNITLFDNGDCHDPQISKAKEYELDETNKTATLVWEYEHPKEIYSETMGNVQRLSNGNTYINWGRITNTSETGGNLLSTITEVKSDKTIAYELTFDTYFHLIYRSYRFKWDVAPPVSSNIKIESNNTNIQLFPNPASDFLNILIRSGNNGKCFISIMDLSGTVIKNLKYELHPRENTFQLNISDLSDGVYFCRFSSETIEESIKFVVIR